MARLDMRQQFEPASDATPATFGMMPHVASGWT
jgi:hypothetical protein